MLVPAIVLTLVFDRVGLAIDPMAYRAPYYADQPLGQVLWRGLSFSHEWSGTATALRLGTNAPLWSISFEAAYYAIFGIAVFVRGWMRPVLLAGIVALAGLPVMLLFPMWLAGVLVWRLQRRGGRFPSRPVALALAVVPVVILVALKSANIDNDLLRLTGVLVAPEGAWQALRWAQEVLWNSVIAAALALHLIGMARVAPALPRALPRALASALARGIRWLAGASFSVYVMHYPIMHLLDATLPEDIALKSAVFIVVPLGLCLIFAELFERPLPRLRAMLSRRTLGAPAPKG